VTHKEQAMALRSGGDLDAAYGKEKTVFRPTLAERTTASAMEAAARISTSVEQQLGYFSARSADDAPVDPRGCRAPWGDYCDGMHRAVDRVLGEGRYAVTVTQPYYSAVHVEQQRELAGMLQQRFLGQPKLRRIDLGASLDLTDPTLAYDGLHLTAAGHEVIAQALAEPLWLIIRATRKHAPRSRRCRRPS
jgi:hypothetical protein